MSRDRGVPYGMTETRRMSAQRVACAVLIGGLAFALVSCAARQPTSTDTAVRRDPDALDRVFEQTFERFGLPGLALGVIENGRIAYVRTQGERIAGSGETIDADTLFKIASNSKAMTTALLARLVDAGKLDWNDPVTRHLASFRMHDPWVTREMQVRDLLIKEYDLKDPILRVKTNFAAAAGKRLGGPTLTPVPAPFMIGEGPDRLKMQFGRETVLDFATTYWGVLPLPFEPTDIVAYRARARLIRFPEGQILWQGGCDLEGKDTSSGPKGANAQGPKSGGLKETFDLLADTCADQLVAQFMGKEGDK